MKDSNYYVIQGWMRNKLNLKGNALLVYAIIYGFTQAGEGEYKGSLAYITGATGMSRTTAITTLKDLHENDYITKKTEIKNNITHNKYETNLRVVNTLFGMVEITPPGTKTVPPGTKTVPDTGTKTVPNRDQNNKDKDKDLNINKQFEQFWTVYPSNIKKKNALAAFKKVMKEKGTPPIEELIKIIELWKCTESWKAKNGQFVPHPTTWLNGARWEDTLPANQRPPIKGKTELEKAMGM